jgi:glycosyltransferase involved in cell wall biosynthesis
MRLAIVTTHPVQYYAPVFKLLAQRNIITINVFYTWGKGAMDKYDPGFDKVVSWDIPVLDGYPHQWLTNSAPDPGSHHFQGIITPYAIEQIAAWKPDAILVFGWAYNSHLKILRHFKGKLPVFFRGDSTLLDEAVNIKSILKTIFLKWIYKHVNHAFYVGQNNKAYFTKYGLKQSQLSFAPHAVDNDRFAEPVAKNDLREKLGINQEDVLILFAGKLEDKKDPMLLLDAFLSINKTNLHLLFVGSGPLKKQLLHKAKGFDNIHFIDFQNQTKMPLVYQACDVFCLPSKGPGETWGLAVNEAMACSKVIVVSDKVGCAADLAGPDNGVIFKSGDKSGLAEILQILTADRNKLITMGLHSASLIKNYNFTAIANAIEYQMLHINT